MNLQDRVVRYLDDALGVQPTSRPWAGAAKLPYFLQEEFELHELRAAGRTLLLAVNRRKKGPTPATLRERLEKLEAAAQQPVVYSTETLASYERKRLIEQKVPFIVPGNQLYLPDLGIDLREYFRQAPEVGEGFTPAAQAMVLRALLSGSTQIEWNPAAIGKEMGYTAMTVSRVAKELAATGVAKVDRRGRARWLSMERPPEETWGFIRPMLRTPIKKQFWARASAVLDRKRVPLAGLSALALYTALADPARPVYAIGPEQLRSAAFKSLAPLPEPQTDGCEVQVWSYAPILEPEIHAGAHKAVDPLSLTASLLGSGDERIELALDELKEHFPW